MERRRRLSFLCVLGLCGGAQADELDMFRIEVRATPPVLALSSDPSARLDIAVSDPQGRPLSGVRLEPLARLGRVSVPEELGAGRYQATYFPPATRFPQLELIAIRAEGRGLGWLPLPLRGRGTVEVETDPAQPVWLEVAGAQFGPVQSDQRGRALINFEAPPGVRSGQVITGQGPRRRSHRAIDLGIPLTNSIMIALGATSLIADGRSEVRIDIYTVDADNRPAVGLPLRLRSDAGRISPAVELAPGLNSARLRSPESVGTGLLRIDAEVQGRGDEYRASALLTLLPGPPARLIASARPASLPADGRSRALLEARLLDRTGNPVDQADVALRTSAGALTPVERGPDHVFQSWLTAPPVPGDVQVSVSATAPGAPSVAAELRVPVEALPLDPPKALSASPPTAAFDPRAFLRWTSLGLGLAALVPGAVLVVLDGRQTCDAPSQVVCPEVYDTLTGGAVLLGLGSALTATSVALFLIGAPEESSKPALSILPGPSQLLVTGTLRF